MPTELTTDEVSQNALDTALETTGTAFMPEPVVEEAAKPAEPAVETKTPEQVRDEKRDQMIAQVASSLKKLEERKEALEVQTAGRDKPLTVAQQEEARVIKEKTDRAKAKLIAIKALPEEEANVHSERGDMLDASIELAEKLEKQEAEIAELKAFREETKRERENAATAKEMKEVDPDFETNFGKVVDEVHAKYGVTYDEKTEDYVYPDDAPKAFIEKVVQTEYGHLLKTLKPAKPTDKKPTTAPRGPPKTTGGGTYAAQHAPAAVGQTQAGPTFEDVGRQFM